MAVGPLPPVGQQSKSFLETYRHHELAGHNPDTPWWATPLGILGFVAVFLVVVGLWLWL